MTFKALVAHGTLFNCVCLQQTRDGRCHVGAGLVRGSAALSFLQWFGRSNVLFLVLHSIPEVRHRCSLESSASRHAVDSSFGTALAWARWPPLTVTVITFHLSKSSYGCPAVMDTASSNCQSVAWGFLSAAVRGRVPEVCRHAAVSGPAVQLRRRCSRAALPGPLGRALAST